MMQLCCCVQTALEGNTLSLAKRSSYVAALRSLYDECEIQILHLESLGAHSDTYGSLLRPVLLQLIPNDISLDYTRQTDRL